MAKQLPLWMEPIHHHLSWCPAPCQINWSIFKKLSPNLKTSNKICRNWPMDLSLGLEEHPLLKWIPSQKIYISYKLPIKIPPAFFSPYKQVCTNFLWLFKHPRLGWDRLSTPKLKGGIGLLDIHKYYWSCHLARVVDWHVHSCTKDWVRLEESFSQISIRHLPWIWPSLIPKQSTKHPLSGPTLQNFRAACRKRNLASSLDLWPQSIESHSFPLVYQITPHMA